MSLARVARSRPIANLLSGLLAWMRETGVLGCAAAVWPLNPSVLVQRLRIPHFGIPHFGITHLTRASVVVMRLGFLSLVLLSLVMVGVGCEGERDGAAARETQSPAPLPTQTSVQVAPQSTTASQEAANATPAVVPSTAPTAIPAPTDASKTQEIQVNGDAGRPSADAPAAKAPKLGPVHKLTVQDLDGNDVSLAQFAGRPMIIEIWATWCGPCKVNRRNVHSLKGQLPERLVVIGMSMDTGPQLVKSFLRSNEANPYEFMASEEFNTFIRDINPSGLIPKTLYVDSKGRVADLAEGVQSVEWLKAMSKNLK